MQKALVVLGFPLVLLATCQQSQAATIAKESTPWGVYTETTEQNEKEYQDWLDQQLIKAALTCADQDKPGNVECITREFEKLTR